MGLLRWLFGPANLRGVVVGDGQFKFAIVGTSDHQQKATAPTCRRGLGRVQTEEQTRRNSAAKPLTKAEARLMHS